MGQVRNQITTVLKKIFTLTIYITFFTNVINSENNVVNQSKPLEIGASYTGDLVSNFVGGIKTGTTYLGLINVAADFDTQQANWWNGGEFFVNIANTHGGTPSANLVGDFQGISNIEAGNLTFLYELWYKQNIGQFEFTLGLQDLNANFATNENGAIFTNSSFGIHSSLADNISTPIFPLTALGINAKWDISDEFTWQAAIFDGTPDDFENNPFNVNWKLSKEQGFLVATEFQYLNSLLKNRTGNYKLGIYFHEHNDYTNAQQENGGLYFVGEQQVTENFYLFSQIGFSPKSKNTHNQFYSLGLNCKKVFEKRPNDEFGLAIAYAGIDGNNVGSETAIELLYLFSFSSHFYLKPDLEYIINPAGTNVKLPNALVGSIRVGLNF